MTELNNIDPIKIKVLGRSYCRIFGYLFYQQNVKTAGSLKLINTRNFYFSQKIDVIDYFF